jgi:hypothetical protein
MTSLYAQVVNRLSLWNCASLPVMASSVGRGLAGEVVELGAGHLQPQPAPGDLAPGDADQQLMQARRGRVPLRAGIGQGPQPSGRLRIGTGDGDRDLTRHMPQSARGGVALHGGRRAEADMSQRFA